MQIGQWQLIEEIGSGGGGTVYKARDIHSDQIVALKKLSLPPGLERENLKQRFLREARAMAKINSDFVVRLYASQIIDDNPVLVMECLSAGSLATEISEGPFAPGRVVTLLHEALQGLDAVHQAGVVHRDIKPSNLLRSEAGRYKIADFGISGQIGSAHTMHAGTAQYAAPEYLTDPENIDGRADLYSLGLCAYEAALGREGFQKALQQHAGVDPYVASAQWHAWLADATKEVPPLHHILPDVPLELSKLISKLLAKEPGRRYHTCAAALEDLKQLDLAARASTGANEKKEQEREPGKTAATKAKNKTPVALIGVSVAVTVLILVAAVMRQRPPEPTPEKDIVDIIPANKGPDKPTPPPTPPPPPKRDTWSEFERLADESGERLQITNVRAEYGVGDSMSMDIVLPRPGYLNVLSISDVTGAATVLFPNDFATDNHFARAGVARLPAPGSKYRLAFALPDGSTEEKNLLVAFLTEQPVNARQLAANAAQFRELTTPEASTARGAIVADNRYAAGKQPYLLNSRASSRPPGGESPPTKGSR